MLSDMHLNKIVYRDIYDLSVMHPVKNEYKDKLDLTSKTLYFASSANSKTAQIIVWQ